MIRWCQSAKLGSPDWIAMAVLAAAVVCMVGSNVHAAEPQFVLRKGDRIVFIGNTFADHVADRRGSSFVDLFTLTKDLMHYEPSQRLTSNGIHLNEYGYWAVSQLIADELTPRKQIVRVDIDAARGIVKAHGTKVEHVQIKKGGLPVPAPPAKSIVHSRLAERRPILVVRNLAHGIKEFFETALVVTHDGKVITGLLTLSCFPRESGMPSKSSAVSQS